MMSGRGGEVEGEPGDVLDQKDLAENNVRVFQDFQIVELREAFQRYSSQIQGWQMSLEQAILEPILTYLQDLQYNCETRMVSGIRELRSLEGLFKFIVDQEALFEKNYPLASDQAELIVSAFQKLDGKIRSYAKDYLRTEAKAYNQKMRTLTNRIDDLERGQAFDICKIICCIGWCPIEYAITLCNCFLMCDGQDSPRECASPQTRFSMWAPVSSIKNLVEDISNKSQAIAELEPQVMEMI